MQQINAATTTATLADPHAAIAFALDRLEPFEVSEFLKEWREGKNLTPWLDALEADRAMREAA